MKLAEFQNDDNILCYKHSQFDSLIKISKMPLSDLKAKNLSFQVQTLEYVWHETNLLLCIAQEYFVAIFQ